MGVSIIGVAVTYGKFAYGYGTLSQKVASLQAELNETKEDFKKINGELFRKLDSMVEHMADIKTNTALINDQMKNKVDKAECAGCM
jgi:hypothetical protein